MKIVVSFLGTLIFFIHCSFGQVDSTAMKLAQFPNRLFAKINNKANSLDDALTKQTEKYLLRLAKKEKKIHEHIYKLDSNAAKNIFNGSQEKYTSLENSFRDAGTTNAGSLNGEYAPYVDSIKSSILFAQKNPQLLNSSPRVQEEINASLAQFNKLQNNFQNADQVKDYIRQRKEILKQQLNQYVQNSFVKKYLDQYNSECYYFSEQVREYKEALNDPDKMLQKALIILDKIPAFTHFIQQNGQLAGLFGLSQNYGTPEAVIGLQTRDQVQQLFLNQVAPGGAGGMDAVQNNLDDAHSQLDQLKQKISTLGNGSADIDMPNFKPNNQKTKTFLKRLEVSMNLQTTRANFYFPTTVYLGLSLGYKASDKTTFGIGISYNMGCGTGIQHIAITNQGLGLRSFIDVMIKNNIYLSGGFEANYTTPFTTILQLRTTTMWEKSGLIGLSKMISLPGKLVKKTKVSVLWDFLSYYQIPPTQPILFRIGYSL